MNTWIDRGDQALSTDVVTALLVVLKRSKYPIVGQKSIYFWSFSSERATLVTYSRKGLTHRILSVYASF